MTEPVLIEVQYGQFKAIVPTFNSLPYMETREVIDAYISNQESYDIFNRSLELFCKNLAPEKMEELRSHSLDDIVKIIGVWIEKSTNAHQ